jgi:hypothetical protein
MVRRYTFAAAALAALAFVLVAPSGAAAAKGLPNLVVNGDAEAVPPSPNPDNIAAPGWETYGGLFAEVAYGTPSFPGTDVAAKIGGGARFFAGGPNPGNGTTIETQWVNVTSYAAAIDAGTEPATLSALLGGSGTRSNYAAAAASYGDTEGNLIQGAPLWIGPVVAATRHGVTGLLPETATAILPVGTREIQIIVTLDDNGVEGYDDAYADNISLTLGKVTPATPKAPVARGPRDVALRRAPGGKSVRVEVQYTTPAACAKRCAAHAQLRVRSGRRLYAATLPGDGPIILATRGGLILRAHETIHFYLTVSKAALRKAPFTTLGFNRVARTRLRVWVSTPSGQILTVRDGHITVSVERVRSGALPGLTGILQG